MVHLTKEGVDDNDGGSKKISQRSIGQGEGQTTKEQAPGTTEAPENGQCKDRATAKQPRPTAEQSSKTPGKIDNTKEQTI